MVSTGNKGTVKVTSNKKAKKDDLTKPKTPTKTTKPKTPTKTTKPKTPTKTTEPKTPTKTTKPKTPNSRTHTVKRGGEYYKKINEKGEFVTEGEFRVIPTKKQNSPDCFELKRDRVSGLKGLVIYIPDRSLFDRTYPETFYPYEKDGEQVAPWNTPYEQSIFNKRMTLNKYPNFFNNLISTCSTFNKRTNKKGRAYQFERDAWTFKEYLEKHKPNLDMMVFHMRHLAYAIQQLQKLNLAHTDIKLDNLFFDKNNDKLYLIDLESIRKLDDIYTTYESINWYYKSKGEHKENDMKIQRDWYDNFRKQNGVNVPPELLVYDHLFKNGWIVEKKLKEIDKNGAPIDTWSFEYAFENIDKTNKTNKINTYAKEIEWFRDLVFRTKQKFIKFSDDPSKDHNVLTIGRNLEDPNEDDNADIYANKYHSLQNFRVRNKEWYDKKSEKIAYYTQSHSFIEQLFEEKKKYDKTRFDSNDPTSLEKINNEDISHFDTSFAKKYDVFSFGLILQHVLGYYFDSKSYRNDPLFKKLSWIKNKTFNMNPYERYNIDQVIRCFDKLINYDESIQYDESKKKLNQYPILPNTLKQNVNPKPNPNETPKPIQNRRIQSHNKVPSRYMNYNVQARVDTKRKQQMGQRTTSSTPKKR